jgi:hypothetical protein
MVRILRAGEVIEPRPLLLCLLTELAVGPTCTVHLYVEVQVTVDSAVRCTALSMYVWL